MNNIQVSKNFKLREFECKDGSKLVKIDRKLVETLQKLRDRLGKPIIITSSYRTPAHNKKVGGATNSQHIHGTAADIKVNGMTPRQLLPHAEAVGFTGIGLYTGHLHVDVRKGKARWGI